MLASVSTDASGVRAALRYRIRDGTLCGIALTDVELCERGDPFCPATLRELCALLENAEFCSMVRLNLAKGWIDWCWRCSFRCGLGVLSAAPNTWVRVADFPSPTLPPFTGCVLGWHLFARHDSARWNHSCTVLFLFFVFCFFYYYFVLLIAAAVT
jgi:hypothetical protein